MQIWEFLGKLGIDPKLLIAQIVNFAILLWILKKFLYNPIVNRIEKDEKSLKESKEAKDKLDQEKEEFEKKQRQELSQARKNAQQIISQAETVAEKIKQEKSESARKEGETIISRAKERLASLEPEVREKVIKEMRGKIPGRFERDFVSLEPDLRKKLNAMFWKSLVDRVKELDLKQISQSEIVEASKKLSGVAKGEKKKIEEAVAEIIGPVVLHYVVAPAKKDEKELLNIISKKLGVEPKLNKISNKDLISGFRLELAGLVVESNLLEILNNATDIK